MRCGSPKKFMPTLRASRLQSGGITSLAMSVAYVSAGPPDPRTLEDEDYGTGKAVVVAGH